MKHFSQRSSCPQCDCGRSENEKPLEPLSVVREKIQVITDELGHSEIQFPAGTCKKIRGKIRDAILGNHD